jgi:hypothetical protein
MPASRFSCSAAPASLARRPVRAQFLVRPQLRPAINLSPSGETSPNSAIALALHLL